MICKQFSDQASLLLFLLILLLGLIYERMKGGLE